MQKQVRIVISVDDVTTTDRVVPIPEGYGYAGEVSQEPDNILRTYELYFEEVKTGKTILVFASPFGEDLEPNTSVGVYLEDENGVNLKGKHRLFFQGVFRKNNSDDMPLPDMLEAAKGDFRHLFTNKPEFLLKTHSFLSSLYDTTHDPQDASDAVLEELFDYTGGTPQTEPAVEVVEYTLNDGTTMTMPLADKLTAKQKKMVKSTSPSFEVTESEYREIPTTNHPFWRNDG